MFATVMVNMASCNPSFKVSKHRLTSCSGHACQAPAVPAGKAQVTPAKPLALLPSYEPQERARSNDCQAKTSLIHLVLLRCF
jgi:hypothetical protein